MGKPWGSAALFLFVLVAFQNCGKLERATTPQPNVAVIHSANVEKVTYGEGPWGGPFPGTNFTITIAKAGSSYSIAGSGPHIICSSSAFMLSPADSQTLQNLMGNARLEVLGENIGHPNIADGGFSQVDVVYGGSDVRRVALYNPVRDFFLSKGDTVLHDQDGSISNFLHGLLENQIVQSGCTHAH